MHKRLSGALSVEHLTVAIAGLPPQLTGIRLVQLSDLHYDGQRLSESMLADAIAASNQAQPDIVVLTGDYVTDDPSPIYPLAARLKQLQSRIGTYAVLGNHDTYYFSSKKQVIEALTLAGIQVLCNQIAYPFGAELPLIGLADFWSSEFNPSILNQIDADTPRLVLSHNPDSAEILQRWRVDLQLSGHTHGGQVVIPGFGPAPSWPGRIRNHLPELLHHCIPMLSKKRKRIIRHWEWAEGLHKVGNNLLYVNRGLGTYFPGRLFCPPEVTVITLESAPAIDI
jgi:uncharacterized protein